MNSVPNYMPEAVEQMDSPGLSTEELALVERALDRINYCSGTFFRVSTWLFREYMKNRISQEEGISFLDIGCGGGGLLRYLEQFARRRRLKVSLFGIDTNQGLLSIAKNQSVGRQSIEYSGSRIEVLNQRFSLIHSNLVLHHLNPKEVVPFLQMTKERATMACRHEDLLRSRAGVLLAQTFPQIITRSRVVHHDAVVSVHRSHSTEEWQHIAKECGCQFAKVFPEKALLWCAL